MNNIKSKIYKIEGKLPGKTLVILGGVHGNEKAGVMTLDYLRENLELKQGSVYLIYANPAALEKNIRYENKNLNRNFYRKEKCEVYEDVLAEEVMNILDTCDAMLDLHAYNEPLGESKPFAICEPDCLDIVKSFDVSIVVSGLKEYEQGATDEYMFLQGKPGVCVELGAIEEPEKYVELGINTATRFLQYFGCIEGSVLESKQKQLLLQASGMYKKQTEDFTFAQSFKTFDKIKKGEYIATDGGEKIYAEDDCYILFPQAKFPVGIEAFVLAKEYEN